MQSVLAAFMNLSGFWYCVKTGGEKIILAQLFCFKFIFLKFPHCWCSSPLPVSSKRLGFKSVAPRSIEGWREKIACFSAWNIDWFSTSSFGAARLGFGDWQHRPACKHLILWDEWHIKEESIFGVKEGWGEVGTLHTWKPAIVDLVAIRHLLDWNTVNTLLEWRGCRSVAAPAKAG